MNAEKKRRWLDWRVVLIVLAVILLLPFLMFAVQRVVSPAVARAETVRSAAPLVRATKGKVVVHAHKSNSNCWTPAYSHDVTGNVPVIGGVGTLFTGAIWQKYCYWQGRILSWAGTGYNGSVTTFGESLNWSYQGLYSFVGPDIHNTTGCFGCLVTKRVLRFHECTPFPTGCIFPRDYLLGLWIKAWGDGSAVMGWWTA